MGFNKNCENSIKGIATKAIKSRKGDKDKEVKLGSSLLGLVPPFLCMGGGPLMRC